MIFSDSTSSQAAHRQRRLAADEKVRVDKAVNDAAVREGVVRQAGEVPTRGEVDRFRSLMQSRAQNASIAHAKGSARESEPRVHTGTSGAASAAPHDDLLARNIGERFRALFDAPVDAGRAAGAEERDDALAGTREPADAEGPATHVSGSTPDEAHTRPTEPGAPAERGASTLSQPLADKPVSGKAAERAGDDPADAKAAHGNAVDASESPQQLAHRVARGEVHAAPVRSARKGDAKAGGDGKDATSTGGIGAQASVPISNDSAMSGGVKFASEGPQQAQVAAGVIAPGLSELIEKHVKQLLVSDARGSRSRSREVLLRMQSDILPGTDLWLTRSGEGWQLRADVRSRDAYDTLLANQEELIQRFADRALGALTIDPVFHGEGSAVAGLGSTAIARQR